MKLAAIFLALSVGTAQADEPRYDNTSIETLKASAQEVMASMDPEGKAALSRVIGKLMMDTSPRPQVERQTSPSPVHPQK